MPSINQPQNNLHSTETKPLSNLINSLGIFAFVISLIFIYNDIFKGFWDHDGGYFFMQSSLIAEGKKPYLDFTTVYPPFYNFINSIPLRLGVDRWLLSWTIPIIWIAVASILSAQYWASKAAPHLRVWRWFIAAAVPLFCIDFGGNHNTLELGVIVFGLAALTSSTKENHPSLFLTGLFVALAFLSKQVGILLLLPFLTQVKNLKHGLFLTFGFCLPVFATLAWLEFDISKIQESHSLLANYLGGGKPGIGLLLERFFKMIWIDVFRTPVGVVFFTLCLGYALACTYTYVKQAAYRKLAWILSWTALALMFLGARAFANFPHYTLNCWPPLLVLLCTATVELHRNLLVRSGVVAASLAACLLVFFYPKIHTMSGANYFSRWQADNDFTQFILPVALDLKKTIPASTPVLVLGPEEDMIPFLAGIHKINNDWIPDTDQIPISGEFIVFMDYDHPLAVARKNQILQKGYRVEKVYARNGSPVVLFKKTSAPN